MRARSNLPMCVSFSNMSEDESAGDSPLDQLKARHRQENKDMQAEVQRIKKAVPKGDNKRKKAAQTEIEALEKTTLDRHAKELADLEAQLKQSQAPAEAETAAVWSLTRPLPNTVITPRDCRATRPRRRMPKSHPRHSYGRCEHDWHLVCCCHLLFSCV